MAVFHTRAGEVYALQADCPHRSGPLADGLTGGTTIICPLHDRAFDLRNGAGINNDDCVMPYPVRLSEDGSVLIELESSTIARVTANQTPIDPLAPWPAGGILLRRTEEDRMKIEGGCLCGKVRYSADAEPAFVGVCHCKNCQKGTGTAFSYRLPVISICGRVIRQAYHVWGVDDAGILLSQRTGGGRAAALGATRERACLPAGSDDRQHARGDGA